MPHDDAALRLAFAGLAPRRVDTLCRRFGGVDAAVQAVSAGRVELDAAIVDAVRVDADGRRSQLADLGVSFVCRGSSRYPAHLDRFEDAPRWLFVKGVLDPGPSVAIVGTRTCTAYGSELAERYGHAAAEVGWTVVSGLARGIDRAGHAGASAAGGRCVAVLGSGIDVVYPRANRRLHDAILLAGGAVVSEYPPGTRPDGWRFPTRNRIIAGLSDVVVVIEAGSTGGALITARVAVDYGVPVFAVPGDIDRPASLGTNLLIRDGAFPVFDAEDFATTLGIISPLVERVA